MAADDPERGPTPPDVEASGASAMAALLLLHLVAYTARIWTYPLLAAFGCLWIAAELRERAPARQKAPSRFWPARPSC